MKITSCRSLTVYSRPLAVGLQLFTVDHQLYNRSIHSCIYTVDHQLQIYTQLYIYSRSLVVGLQLYTVDQQLQVYSCIQQITSCRSIYNCIQQITSCRSKYNCILQSLAVYLYTAKYIQQITCCRSTAVYSRSLAVGLIQLYIIITSCRSIHSCIYTVDHQLQIYTLLYIYSRSLAVDLYTAVYIQQITSCRSIYNCILQITSCKSTTVCSI